jgi:hypothetical protein
MCRLQSGLLIKLLARSDFALRPTIIRLLSVQHGPTNKSSCSLAVGCVQWQQVIFGIGFSQKA